MPSTLAGLSEYQKLLQAVESYYGAGSDQWLTIATSAGYHGTEWYNVVKQVPNVDVVMNNAGQVVSYTVRDTWGTVGENAAAAAVNSNAQAATMANTSTLQVPANTTVTAGGTVVAGSGMKAAATGSTVATTVGTVALAVGAVASGLQCGAKLAEGFYNINPDFWDERGWGTLDPQTWDMICTTEGGKNAFNWVFGIDKTAGTTQAYMDETAFAYAALYMQMQHMFETSSHTEYTGALPVNISRELTSIYDAGTHVYSTPLWPNGSEWGIDFTVPSGCKAFITNNNSAIGQVDVFLVSKQSFSVNYDMLYRNTTPSPQVANSASCTYNGETLYYTLIRRPYILGDGHILSPALVDPPLSSSFTNYNGVAGNDNNTTSWSYAKVILDGDVIAPPAGVSPQTGATYPDLSQAATVADALTALKTQYPDLWDNSIYNDVVQPDGTVKRIVYVPVPIPENISVDSQGNVQPTGGTEYGSTQANPTVDPTQTPENIIDTLLQLITAINPQNPTQTPDTPATDYPDTGTGNTPAIVIPTGSASALYSIYNPSQSQLNSFGAWLWSSDFVDQLLKIFNDPMQSIIGLHKVFATPPTSGSGNIKVGYLNSGVSANLVSNQYTEVDCGTVNLREYFGNALDYTNTDIYLYLPFIGITPLNVSDVMRGAINVKYKVDVVTGACLASVNVTRDNNAGGQLYTYGGNCAVQYPLSSGSYMGIVTGLLGVAGSIAGTIASGGALLPMALGVGASAFHGAKTQVQHSGSISGSAGAMGIKKPYLIIRRPQTVIASGFETFDGLANNKTVPLSSCSGFTRVKSIHVENVPATGDELAEIETILKDGVII